jgi:hypothetical protein
MHRPAKRFDAETVSRRKGAPLPAIPEDKSKHAVQMLDDIRSPAPVAFENHFGVRMRVEAGPAPSKFLSEFREIIDLAVENDDVTSVHTVHRLSAGGQINN